MDVVFNDLGGKKKRQPVETAARLGIASSKYFGLGSRALRDKAGN